MKYETEITRAVRSALDRYYSDEGIAGAEKRPKGFWTKEDREVSINQFEQISKQLQHMMYEADGQIIEKDEVLIVFMDDHDLSSKQEELVRDPESNGLTQAGADSLACFWETGRTDFSSLTIGDRGAKDKWSKMRLKELVQELGEEDYQKARGYLIDDKSIAAALRWHGRGLSLADSIRKVESDKKRAIEVITQKQQKGDYR